MTKIAYRQMTGRDGAIANRKEFEGNSIRAKWLTYAPHTERLNVDDSNELRRLFLGNEPVYIIFSYSTPIAWAKSGEFGYVTDQRFSVTTSKQQGYVRAWLNYRLP